MSVPKGGKAAAGQLSQARRLLRNIDDSLELTAPSDAFSIVNGLEVQSLRGALLQARAATENILRRVGERHYSLPPKQEHIDQYRNTAFQGTGAGAGVSGAGSTDLDNEAED